MRFCLQTKNIKYNGVTRAKLTVPVLAEFREDLQWAVNSSGDRGLCNTTLLRQIVFTLLRAIQVKN